MGVTLFSGITMPSIGAGGDAHRSDAFSEIYCACAVWCVDSFLAFLGMRPRLMDARPSICGLILNLFCSREGVGMAS